MLHETNSDVPESEAKNTFRTGNARKVKGMKMYVQKPRDVKSLVRTEKKLNSLFWVNNTHSPRSSRQHIHALCHAVSMLREAKSTVARHNEEKLFSA